MPQDYEYNRRMHDAFQREIDKYPDLMRQLGEMSEQDVKLLLTQYQNKQEELGFKTGESIYDFMTQYRGAQERGGFSGSGALERGRERGVGMIEKDYEFGKQSLFDQYQESKLGIGKEYWRERIGLDKWRTDLQMQQSQLDTEAPGFWDRIGKIFTDPIGSKLDITEEIF